MLQKARAFFAEKNILEVDCPALSQSAPVDLHIEVMRVGQRGYLHTSPEYGMKRLLALGIGDIYQLSHVFREGEIGLLHNPEFTMAEWYRIGFSFEQMLEETCDFIRLFLGDLPVVQMTYRELLRQFLGIDYVVAMPQELIACAKTHGLDVPSGAFEWDKDTLLQWLIGFLIEPNLGRDHLFVLTQFPASQAALSRTQRLEDGEEVAYRFEVYVQGMELANGYKELTDATEQRTRLERTNEERERAGKVRLKIDENLLEALRCGIPECCGVAVGFDRLMLLRLKEQDLKTILPFSWEEA